jgi:hypothetical protein
MVNRIGQRRDSVLLAVDRAASPPAVELTSESSLLDALDRFCDLTPFASLQLLASRRIIFHEGSSDRRILEACARIHFANDPARQAAFRRWTWAQLRGADNASAKELLKQDIAPLFPALQAGDRIHLVRVLDRDLRRTPVFGPVTRDDKAHVDELDVVWSRHSIESLFLDAACLTAWLHGALGAGPDVPAEPDLRALIEQAITAANADPELTRDVVNQLVPLRMGALPAAQVDSAQAYARTLREANETARREPHIWQRGHDRARFVLSWVRDRLPARLQNKVRREIEQVVTAWPGSALASSALIPDEIRMLLDHLAK